MFNGPFTSLSTEIDVNKNVISCAPTGICVIIFLRLVVVKVTWIDRLSE